MIPAWFSLSMVTLVLWGAWGILAKVATDSVDPRSATVFQGLGAAVVTLLLLLFHVAHLESNVKGVTAGVLAGVVFMIGMATFTAALSGGRASIIVPMTALYPLVTIVLGVAILSETLTLPQVAGMGFALLAIVLMSR